MIKLRDLHWNKCAAFCLAAFIIPIGKMLMIGGSPRQAAWNGVGAAAIAFAAFIQNPMKGSE